MKQITKYKCDFCKRSYVSNPDVKSCVTCKHKPKFIMDGLKKSGVIRDDSTKVVDLDWSIGPVVEIGRTEIMIWEG